MPAGHFAAAFGGEDAAPGLGIKLAEEASARNLKCGVGLMSRHSRPLQELVTEYCWWAVWTRPGLSRKTRSLINLAMLTALNRPHEVELHLRGALRNGCTKEEIMEVLLQTAIYCGVPAAVDSFRLARKIFSDSEP